MTSSSSIYRLTIQTTDGLPHDLQVVVPASAAGSDVLAAVEEHLRLREGSNAAAFARNGEALDDRPWSSLKVRHGDRILLRDRASGTDARLSVLSISVTEPGRPERRVDLPEGRHTVGRDAARSTVVVDDPTVSGSHVVLVAARGTPLVEVLPSLNGTSVEGEDLTAGDSRIIGAGDVVRIANTVIRVVAVAPAAAAEESDGPFVLFNRPPRMPRPVEPVVVTVSAPPPDPPKGRIPMASAAIPLIVTAAIFLIAPGQNPAFLAFALLSPAVLVASYWEDRRHGGAEFKRLDVRFRAAVTRAVQTARDADVSELAARIAESPGPTAVAGRATGEAPGLWERRSDHPDFLRLRIGVGRLATANRVIVEAGGADSLQGWAAEQCTGIGVLEGAPALLDLPAVGSVGIAGPRDGVTALGTWLLMQVATLHSPRDVAVAAVVRSTDAGHWQWLKWLPHVRWSGSPIRVPAIADESSATKLLAEVRRVRAERTTRTMRRGDAGSVERPWIVLIIDSRVPIDRPAISSLLATGVQAGITVIWLGGRPQELPGDCRAVVDIGGDGTADLSGSGPGGRVTGIRVDTITPSQSMGVAAALAPVVDVSAEEAGAALPSGADLLATVGADTGDIAAWMRQRWDGPQVAIGAPIGVDTRGPVILDLEKHGPHGLVAGTTGSGKSEALQSMVAAIATLHPPTRVTFLLIDYKGGSAFRECADLPHTVGYVTDLDAGLTTRALASLNAEQHRRERLLLEAGAKDLRTYRELRPDTPLPSLVIVVDEYATLHEALPDFVSGLVDVAQRGRSLGVHLVLGTQSPGGVVGKAIRANIGFRVALRTVDATESIDVIDSDLAFRISPETPGRGYVRFGTGELVLFQSAYAGARRVAEGTESVVVRDFPLFTQEVVSTRPEGGQDPTNLQEIATAASAIWEERGLAAPHRPWLPALPSFIGLGTLPRADAGVAFGMVDEPDLQRQSAAVLDLDVHGGLIAYGAPASGKTTLLRTMVTALCEASRPEDLQIHVIDYGSGGLRALEALPHVGGAIPGDDIERSTRLLRTFRREITNRRAASRAPEPATGSDVGSTLYRGPRFVLVIDGFEGFHAAFEQVAYGEWLEALPRLAAVGRSLGVHLLISASRRSATPGPLVAALERRVILRQSEADEYASFGLRVSSRQKLSLPPGRGFLENGIDVHVAVAGSQEGEETTAIRHLGEAVRSTSAISTPPVRALPSVIPWSSLAPTPDPYALGVLDDDLSPVGASMGDGHMLIAGPHRSGRTTTLAVLARSIKLADPSLQIHLLSCRDVRATVAAPWDLTVPGPDAVTAYLSDRRWEPVVAASGSLVLMVDDVEELAEPFSDTGLVSAVRRRPPPGIWFVVTGQIDEIRSSYGGDWLPRLRKGGHGILLDPDLDNDGDILGVRLPRQITSPRSAGRGFLVRRGGVELIQVASAD